MNDATSALSTVTRYAGALGIDLPAPVVEVVQLQAAISQALQAEPMTTLLTDIATGKLKPAEVHDAIAATVRAKDITERRSSLAPDLDQALGRRARAALQDQGDEIVRRARPAFDQAAATLSTSVEALGVDVTTAALATASPGAIEAWQGRAAAVATLDACRRLRDALGAAGYGRTGDLAALPVTGYIASAKNAADLGRAGQAFRGADRFATVVAAGFTLRFNTAAEAAEVAAIATAATARAAEEAKAKAKEEAKNDPRLKAFNDYADRIAGEYAARAKTPA